MIAIIDMNSEVRHECYHLLSDEHISVAVFHSALTFVDSGALYGAGLLALGKTRRCRTNCETLRWASRVRPDLRTLLLNPMRLCIRPLLEVCNDPSDGLAENECCVSLDALRQAYNAGLLRCLMGCDLQNANRGICHSWIPLRAFPRQLLRQSGNCQEQKVSGRHWKPEWSDQLPCQNWAESTL